MKTFTEVEHDVDLKLDDIFACYIGKPEHCMCGCAGTYYYASKHRNFASKNRGYAVTDDEINDEQIKRTFNLFQQYNRIENINDKIFTLISSKQYTIYCIKAQNCSKH